MVRVLLVVLTLFFQRIFYLTNLLKGINHQILPTVQCTSEKSARFSSIHAICHAFAVSYKMNIQIGLVNETNELVENKHVFDEFASLASQKSEEKAQISFFRVGKIIGDDEFFSINRLLLFSNIKLDEQQKHQAIKDLSSLNNSFVLDENNFVWSKALPGRDNDELIEEEIFDNKPSHLVFFHEERESKTLWESGGPTNLKENICANLFSPWLLKQSCSEFGLCFLELPQQKFTEEMNQMENRRDIVNFFEKKLESLMKMDD
uniref:Uncharacterized protein n=1 Tax=Meloidogyne hapla TaxID=6305 RepID=A0A1I8B2T7_MELHA